MANWEIEQPSDHELSQLPNVQFVMLHDVQYLKACALLFKTVNVHIIYI